MSVRTSIVTLTQNRPDYLSEAIASVEAQTDQDWEHLVFDDGSTEPRVREVLKSAKARNPDKFFYVAPGVRGPANVVGYYWNVLLGFARGRYLTILDDDNRKHPNFLEKMLEPLEADPALDAVSCGWARINQDGQVFGYRHLNLETSRALLCRTNTIDSNALVVRRSVIDKIGQYDATLTTNEDWHFVVRLHKSCQIRHLRDALVDYREHGAMRSNIAVSQLGAHANWDRIRRELFTDEERLEILGYL